MSAPVNNSIGAGGFFGLSNRYMIFDVLQPCRLQSVRVYANSGFNRTIQLRDSAGLILQDTTLYINNGESIITLTFDLPVANNLRLGTAATSNSIEIPMEQHTHTHCPRVYYQ